MIASCVGGAGHRETQCAPAIHLIRFAFACLDSRPQRSRRRLSGQTLAGREHNFHLVGGHEQAPIDSADAPKRKVHTRRVLSLSGAGVTFGMLRDLIGRLITRIAAARNLKWPVGRFNLTLHKSLNQQHESEAHGERRAAREPVAYSCVCRAPLFSARARRQCQPSATRWPDANHTARKLPRRRDTD